MASLILRVPQGSTPLTNAQVDSNFQNLNNALGANGTTTIPTQSGTGGPVLNISPTLTSPTLVTPALGTPSSGNFSTGTFTWPTFNQNTSGSAGSLSATLSVASGGTGVTTPQAEMNRVAGGVTLGQYLRGNGTNVVMSSLLSGDFPTLNQNTSGTAAGLSVTLVVGYGGTGMSVVGTSGNVLTSNGSVWVSNAPSSTFTTIVKLSGTSLQEAKSALASNDIDISLGNYFTKTITEITTLTVSNVPVTGTVASIILDLTNGGAFAVTWWANMKWAVGTAPTLTASGRDILGFFTHDSGTTWNGLVLAKDIK